MVEKRSFEKRFVYCYLYNKNMDINECSYCEYYKGIINNDYTVIKCSFEDETGDI